MPNNLPIEKQVVVTHALAEGNSIRSIERMTGVHRDTIMRLGVRVGEACERYMDENFRNLDCENVQVDEIWGFIGKKQRNVLPGEEGDSVGDVWTYVALDKDSKLVPSFVCGKRDLIHTHAFIRDLSGRVKNKIQLSSDSMNAYLAAVDDNFGDEVHYGQIVKAYGRDEPEGVHRRYSPAPIKNVTRTALRGEPDYDQISTSHVECHNRTTRMHVRRLTRLTNAFSKKFENFRAAMGLWFAYYNLAKMHGTIRCTPAMAAGISSHLWEVRDLVTLSL